MTEITARGNRLRATKRSNLIGGSVGVNPFRVMLDTVWKDFYVSAIFTCNGVTKRVQVFDSGDEYQIPWEILAKENIGNTVSVGLYGVNKDDPAVVMQSEPVVLDILADGTDPIEPSNPTPNEFSYALKRANEAVDQTLTALFETNSARDTAVAALNETEKRCAAVNGKAVEIEGYKTDAEKNAAAASGSASMARAYEEGAQNWAAAAEYWAEQAEILAVPKAKDVYNIVLQDRTAPSDRYALIVENGVLKLLGVKNTVDAATPMLIDTGSGAAWILAVEHGKLLIEEV